MAKTSGLNQRLYAHGWDVSGDVGSVQSCRAARPSLEVPGLDKSAMERIGGLSDGDIEFNSWYNPAGAPTFTAQHGALKNLPTSDVLLAWLLGPALGDDVAFLLAKQNNYDGNRQQDGSLAFTIKGEGNGNALEWADVQTVKTVRTGTGSDANLDGLAAGANGAVGYLEYFAGAGAGTPTFVIEHSVDGATAWATLISFTPIQNAAINTPTAERVATALALTVRRYTRVTVSSAFTSITYMVGFRRRAASDDQ